MTLPRRRHASAQMMAVSKSAQPPLPRFEIVSSTGVLAPTIENSRWIMNRVPIRFIANGRLTPMDIAEASGMVNPLTLQNRIAEADRNLAEHRIKEADYALAATTPVLGQYAPTFGWPEDWGWYWEYLDAYLFIPEVAFAIKLKTRMVWKPGFEFETSNASLGKKLLKEWKKRKIQQSLTAATKNTLIWGNSYIESVDDSVAKFAEGQPADVAMGAGYANLTYAPRPLQSFQPATRFYGLKNTDPRTVRIQIHPQQWNKEKATVMVQKYIQRRWAGPLAPTAVLGSETELDFHPEQMLALQFNKITGGIYGYSMFREGIFTLKGWLLMLQYLPTIFQKRADTLLHVKMGGDRSTETGGKVTQLPTREEILAQKMFMESRSPGEDVYTDAFTNIEQVFKAEGPLSGLQDFLITYKERVLMSLGIPLTVATMAGGQEIKWGTLNFDVLYDEIREYQETLEEMANDYVISRLLLNLGHEPGDGPEVEFHFHDPHPEDWTANVDPLLRLYKEKSISLEYMLDRLNIPLEAMQGTMFQPPQAAPFGGGFPAKIGDRVPKEKWRLNLGGRIVEAEKVPADHDH